jgi:hypothetical protein
MARRRQRWDRTKAACRRRDLLFAIADGRWYRLAAEDRQAMYAALVQLEERGLVRVDRTQRRIRFQIVYPGELVSLEQWVDWEMRRREVAR